MLGRRRRRHEARALTFVDDHLPVVFGYVTGMLGDTPRAREVVRSVLGTVDPPLLDEDDEEALRRLLLLRARRALTEAHALPGAAAPTPAPATGGPPRVLVAGVTELRNDEREALVLVDVVGASPTEAAVLCGVSADEVRRRRHRAHTHLVDRLAGRGR